MIIVNQLTRRTKMTEKFNDEEELQVKSKERVKDFGEVFTNQLEVNFE